MSESNISLDEHYDNQFFESQMRGSYLSALPIIKIILENNLLPQIPKVLDIGCGRGTWLKAFDECTHQTCSLTGIDGTWVDPNDIVYPIDENRNNSFIPVDFESIPQDGFIKNKYDLIQTLEVMEHLSEGVAKNLVKQMCNHTDLVLFSAALPGQGGENHINENWLSYWKDIFSSKDFVLFDVIRPLIWNMPDVEWWYKQNVVLFCRNNSEVYKKMKVAFENKPSFQGNDIVYPTALTKEVDVRNHVEKKLNKIKKNPFRAFRL